MSRCNYCRCKHGQHMSWCQLYSRLDEAVQTVLPPPTKPSNPKDLVGVGKVPMSVVPCGALQELAVALFEGACKYGRHNYRAAGVRASVYYDATQRHLMSWWEGEDLDPDSQLSHITKAIASLTVLRDAMLQSMWHDDRPPRSLENQLTTLNPKVQSLIALYSTVNPQHYTISYVIKPFVHRSES